MNLHGIISISGKPGLFKIITHVKNNVIVESLIDQKKIPANTTDKISSLDDISIYTYDGDVPLKEIYVSLHEKLEGKEAPSHKADISILRDLFLEVLPDYDEERVYGSDIKKIFQWYNILLKNGYLEFEEEEEVEISEENPTEETKNPEEE